MTREQALSRAEAYVRYGVVISPTEARRLREVIGPLTPEEQLRLDSARRVAEDDHRRWQEDNERMAKIGKELLARLNAQRLPQPEEEQ